mmetsp:Transcript_8256/g.25761  ORF Transcript_8256/g.25761 Transcript_8256/m.25761 type:complete len:296 (-) Transcript_8256:193-1080(-)
MRPVGLQRERALEQLDGGGRLLGADARGSVGAHPRQDPGEVLQHVGERRGVATGPLRTLRRGEVQRGRAREALGAVDVVVADFHRGRVAGLAARLPGEVAAGARPRSRVGAEAGPRERGGEALLPHVAAIADAQPLRGDAGDENGHGVRDGRLCVVQLQRAHEGTFVVQLLDVFRRVFADAGEALVALEVHMQRRVRGGAILARRRVVGGTRMLNGLRVAVVREDGRGRALGTFILRRERHDGVGEPVRIRVEASRRVVAVRCFVRFDVGVERLLGCLKQRPEREPRAGIRVVGF